MLEFVLKIHGNDYFVAVKFHPGVNLLAFPRHCRGWNRFLLVHPSTVSGLGPSMISKWSPRCGYRGRLSLLFPAVGGWKLRLKIPWLGRWEGSLVHSNSDLIIPYYLVKILITLEKDFFLLFYWNIVNL